MISTEETTLPEQIFEPVDVIEKLPSVNLTSSTDEQNLMSEDDGWKTLPCKQKLIKKREGKKNEEKREEKNEGRTIETRTVRVKKNLSEKQLLDQFIHSIQNKYLHDGAVYLKKLIFRGSEINAHTRYYQSTDLLNHLSDKNKAFFHQIVRHLDKKTSTKISLWTWNYKESNIYIATTSVAPWYRFSDKRKSPLAKKHYEYNSVVNRFSVQSETDPEALVLSEDGFKELEKLATRDISVEFMKLHFFDSFEAADSFVKIHTNDRILHMKKTRHGSQDESKEQESKEEEIVTGEVHKTD